MAQVNIDLELITRQFDTSLRNTVTSINRFSRVAESNFSRAGGAFNSFIGNLGATAVASSFRLLTESVVGFGGAVISNARTIETLTTQFATLTGGVENAQAVIQDLQEFSARTPFRLEGLATTGRQLLSFGFQTSELIPRLESIGNVASATGSSVQDLGLIFGQISAAGRLTGERLLQLQERGVPILKALSEEFGVTQSAVRELITNGEVDFQTFQRAFDSLSQEGGIAFGGIERQAQTLDGVISTLQDNFSLFSAGIGQVLVPVLKSAAGELTSFIQSIDLNRVRGFVSEGLVALVEGLTAITNSINPVIAGFRVLGNAFTGIFNLILSGINGVQTLFAGFGSTIISIARDVVSGLPSSLVPEGWTESLRLADEATQKTFDSLVNRGSSLSDSLVQDFNDINNALTNDFISEDSLEQVRERLDTLGNTIVDANEKTNQGIVSSNQRRVQQVQAQEKQNNDTVRSFSDELFQTQRDNQGRLLSFETSTNKQRSDNFKSTLGTIATLSESNNKTLGAIGKAAAISTATIDGIVAVQKALASAPPPFNFALAGAVGAATAANVAKIAGVKGFQDGGIIGGNSFVGDNNVARVNSGEMILNRNQQAELFNQANGGGSSTSSEDMSRIVEAIKGLNITLVADDVALATSVSRGVSNGVVIGESE